MAKITIEELSGSLKEYLNGLGLTEAQVQELIDKFEDEKIGDISQLSTEEKGSLVGAINELFQNANNGKELIASAIGEPLSSEDTFSAMSNDINSLLSTFKTNMMNNGVTVESGDKFKQLIDKIATMVEEGSGKGVQFINGEHTLTEDLYALVEPTITINTNLNFDPYYVIVYIPNLTPLSSGYGNNPDVVVTTDCASVEIAAWYGTDYHYRGPKFTLNYTQDTINVKINKSIAGYNMQIPVGTVVKWYAIGVGEEDTTLRDSLASILQEEGVSVTEEDDMASLIGKVDEEFTKDNNTINSLNTNITLLTNQVNSLTNELAGKVTPAGTAVAGDVISGKTFINSTGQTVTGTMANRGGAQTVTPGTSNKTLNAGYYSGNITIAGDADLVAANIVSGKKIFGVTGTAPSCFTTTPNYALNYSSSSGANGIYTVTHNLGRVPTDVIVYMTEIKGGSYNFHTATLDYPSYNVNNKKSFKDYNDDGLNAWIANLTTTTIDIQIKSVGYTKASATIAKVIII